MPDESPQPSTNRELGEHARGAAGELHALILAALFVVIGVGLLWFVKAAVGVTASALLISLLLLPILVYLVVSDRITEISGPGGLSAKFREAAARPVGGGLERVSTREPWSVQKAELSELVRIQSRLPLDRPIVLSFTLPGENYDYWAVKEYADALVMSRGCVLVAFQAADEKLLGYMPTDRFRILLQSAAGGEFVGHLNQQDAVEWLTTAPGVLTERLNPGATNRDALARMQETALDVLVLVDENSRLKSVVERKQVLAAMLLSAS